LSETKPTLAGPDQAATEAPRVGRSHRDRSVAGWDFRWFWAAYSVSTFGDQITLIALPIAVYDRTGSALAVGIAASMQSLTAVSLGLLAGAFADRLRHRPILISTDLLRGALLGGVAVALIRSDSYPVSLLYVTAFGLGALRVLHDAAAGASLPRVVRGTDLLRANGRLSASESAGNTGGPALGGVLISVGGAGLAFVIDAVSFVLSGLGVSRVLALRDRRRSQRGGRAVPPEPRPSIRADVLEGLRVVWADRPFLHGLVLVAAMNVVAVAVEAQFIPYAEELLHLGGAAIGAYFVVGGIAGLAAAAVLSRRQDARGDIVLAGVGFFSAGVMVAGLAPSLVTAGLAYVAAGVGSVMVITHFTALRQRRFPVRLLGRVGMAARTVLFGVLPLAHLGGGWLSRTAGPDAMFVVAAAVGLVATAWGAATGFGRVRMGDVIDLTD
jgi:MFS family permease